MSSDVRGPVASLLAALSEREGGDGVVSCPLATFARSVTALLRRRGVGEAVAQHRTCMKDKDDDGNNNNKDDDDDDDDDGGAKGNTGRVTTTAATAADALTATTTTSIELSDVLADLSLALMHDEEEQRAVLQLLAVTRDKLRAELARVEAQQREHDSRLRDVAVQRRLCKLALNLVVADDVPHLVDVADVTAATAAAAAVSRDVDVVRVTADDEAARPRDGDVADAPPTRQKMSDTAASSSSSSSSSLPLLPSLMATTTTTTRAGGAAGHTSPSESSIAGLTTTTSLTTTSSTTSTSAISGAAAAAATTTAAAAAASLLSASSASTTPAAASTHARELRDDGERKGEDDAQRGSDESATPARQVQQPPSPLTTTVATAAATPRTTSPRRSDDAMRRAAAGVLAVLRLPDVAETTLLRAVAAFDVVVFGGAADGSNTTSSSTTTTAPLWLRVCNDDGGDDGAVVLDEVTAALLALLRHLPRPRPLVQLAELRVLARVLRATPSPQRAHNHACALLLDALVRRGSAASTLCRLLGSINDEVKSEALTCLSPLVCLTHALADANNNNSKRSEDDDGGGGGNDGNNSSGSKGGDADADAHDVAASVLSSCRAARIEFLRGNGLTPLVGIVVSSTSETVLEQALVCLWGVLARSEADDGAHNGGVAVRTRVRELGGLRAVLDLLYTDSLVLLEHVSMVIGYLTRDDAAKAEMREVGGLEKVTATLRHPSASIQAKMAGAVWNCASAAANRSYLRHIGTIPALLELLRYDTHAEHDDAVHDEDAHDDTAVVVDHDEEDSKGRRPQGSRRTRRGTLSSREFVRENAAGALWNLSVDAENKAEMLHYGGVAVLLRVLRLSSSVPVRENVSGTLWNCSALVEVRGVLRRLGGVAVLLDCLRDGGARRPRRRRLPPQEDGHVNGQGDSRDDDDGDGSASRATRAAVRCGGASRRVCDNVAGTLRNCVLDDEGRRALAEHGGLELLVQCICAARVQTTTATAAVCAKKSTETAASSSCRLSSHTQERLAATLLLATAMPELRARMGHDGGNDCLVLLLRTLTAASPALACAAARGHVSPLQVLPRLAWDAAVADTMRSSGSNGNGSSSASVHDVTHGGGGSSASNSAALTVNAFAALYTPAALQHAMTSSVPTVATAVQLSSDVKEKMLGVLRHCVTVADNRRVMLRESVVAYLAAVVLDGYTASASVPSGSRRTANASASGHHASVHNNNSSNSNSNSSSSSGSGGGALSGPSPQVCETVAYMMWHLARDDKVTTRTQGGVQLMCLLLYSARQRVAAARATSKAAATSSSALWPLQESYAVVVEQAAGALASMMLGSVDNCGVACACGGVVALAALLTEHAATSQLVRRLVLPQPSTPPSRDDGRGGAADAAHGGSRRDRVDADGHRGGGGSNDVDVDKSSHGEEDGKGGTRGVANGTRATTRDTAVPAATAATDTPSMWCRAVYNALLALRNCVTTSSRAGSVAYCAEVALAHDAALLRALLCLIEHATDDWAAEAALTLRPLCLGSVRVAGYAAAQHVAPMLQRRRARATAATARSALDAAIVALSHRTHGGEDDHGNKSNGK